jgi:hypothetical protein
LEANLDSVIEELSYQDSLTYVLIRDLKTNELYGNKLTTKGTIFTSAETSVAFECVSERVNSFAENVATLDIMHIFSLFSYPAFNSCIISEASESGFRKGVDLGVTIRVVDSETGNVEYHPALMSISLYEL